jgi:hypothetical protein
LSAVSIDHLPLYSLLLQLPPPFGFFAGNIHERLHIQGQQQNHTTGSEFKVSHANLTANPLFEQKNVCKSILAKHKKCSGLILECLEYVEGKEVFN